MDEIRCKINFSFPVRLHVPYGLGTDKVEQAFEEQFRLHDKAGRLDMEVEALGEAFRRLVKSAIVLGIDIFSDEFGGLELLDKFDRRDIGVAYVEEDTQISIER